MKRQLGRFYVSIGYPDYCPHPLLRRALSRWARAGVRLFFVRYVPTTKVVGCVSVDEAPFGCFHLPSPSGRRCPDEDGTDEGVYTTFPRKSSSYSLF